MSFTSPFSAVVLCNLSSGSKELLDRVPQEAESGWDSMRDTWLCRYDAGGNDAMAILAHFTDLQRADQVSGYNMWIVARTPKLLATGLIRVEVLSMGLLTARGYKVTYDAAAASQTAQNIEVGSVGYAKVATREGGVTATFEYVDVASVGPTNAGFPTKDTGRAKTPPSGWQPTVPATVWDYLTVYTYNYPNGWIFEGISMENLPGLSTVFLKKEKYYYQYDKVPG